MGAGKLIYGRILEDGVAATDIRPFVQPAFTAEAILEELAIGKLETWIILLQILSPSCFRLPLTGQDQVFQYITLLANGIRGDFGRPRHNFFVNLDQVFLSEKLFTFPVMLSPNLIMILENHGIWRTKGGINMHTSLL